MADKCSLTNGRQLKMQQFNCDSFHYSTKNAVAVAIAAIAAVVATAVQIRKLMKKIRVLIRALAICCCCSKNQLTHLDSMLLLLKRGNDANQV